MGKTTPFKYPNPSHTGQMRLHPCYGGDARLFFWDSSFETPPKKKNDVIFNESETR